MKRKDSAVSSEGEIPVKSIAKAKQEKMKRRTLGVSRELHLELKELRVWRIKTIRRQALESLTRFRR